MGIVHSQTGFASILGGEQQSETKGDHSLTIATQPIELAPNRIVSVTTYNGQFPSPLLCFKEGVRVTVDVHNETDTPEQLHWHGQMIPRMLTALPLAIVELFARIRSLIRRETAGKNNNVHLKVIDLRMDLIHRKAARGIKVLNLSPQEFALLEYLCRHAGRVVTRSMLLSAVWACAFNPIPTSWTFTSTGYAARSMGKVENRLFKL
jgi:hypothetical protein